MPVRRVLFWRIMTYGKEFSMKKQIAFVIFAIMAFFCPAASSQTNSPAYASQDPMTNISLEISRISRSVQTLNQRMQAFLDKFTSIGGVSYTEKQQKLLLGLEFLSR